MSGQPTQAGANRRQAMQTPAMLWAAVILTSYAVLILALLGRTPLWLDELQQFGSKRQHTMRELLDWVLVNPGAAPLPYFLQKLIVDWLGYSTWTARLPAALCSLTGGVIFWLVSKKDNLRTRIIALAFFLVLPLQFRYAMEARGYSQGLLFSLISLRLF